MRLIDRFVRVDSNHRCPVCGRPDWCLLSKTGDKAVCTRVESRVEISDVGWVHPLEGLTPADIPENSLSDKIPQKFIIEFHDRCRCFINPAYWSLLSWQLKLPVWALQEFGIGYYKDGNCFSIPMVDENLRVCGVQFRSGDGKWTMSGSSNGLFHPRSLWRKTRKTIFVAEGMTDAASLLTIGCPALGRYSCGTGARHLNAILDRHSEVENVVIVSDTNDDERRGAFKLAKSVQLDRRKIHIIMPSRAKDAREAVRLGADKQSVRDALANRPNRYWKRIDDKS